MKGKKIPAVAIIVIWDIPLYLGHAGDCDSGQVHGEGAERGRVFRVQRI
jgi:hypothetical protein